MRQESSGGNEYFQSAEVKGYNQPMSKLSISRNRRLQLFDG